MNDDDRIQLMLLVKEGKISVQEAVDTVRFVIKQLGYVFITSDTRRRGTMCAVCQAARETHEHVLCQMNF